MATRTSDGKILVLWLCGQRSASHERTRGPKESTCKVNRERTIKFTQINLSYNDMSNKKLIS